MTEHLIPSYQKVEGFLIPICFSPDAFRSGLHYQPRPGDLFISSYPKTGTTWTQMIVMLIRHKGKPPLTALEFNRWSPYLEMCGVESVELNPDLMAIKTHLPLELCPPVDNVKYIYVTRNPKDTLISFFHHTKTPMYLFDDGDFNVFFDLFIEGKTDYGDYFDHVLGWYEHRNDANVLFITYEELKKDTKSCILQIAKFMGQDYAKNFETDPELMDKVIKYSGMEHMKGILNTGMEEVVGDLSKTEKDMDDMNIPSGMKYARKFVIKHRTASSKHLKLIRKGTVGDWRNVFSPEQSKRMDEKIENRLGGTELLEFWKKENCV